MVWIKSAKVMIEKLQATVATNKVALVSRNAMDAMPAPGK